MDFLVELDIFAGPLDLLLYLVRRHEVEIAEIPVAPITDQFLEYISVLEQLDVDAAGDFLEVASTLVEIKSRMLLPHGDEIEEPLEDPRRELVERLLEYKKFKDAATLLDERGRDWQQRFPRLASDLGGPGRQADEEPVREVELWDLVSALARVLREREKAKPSSIVYDDTPIHVYLARIQALLDERGAIAFTELVSSARHKSAIIGMFFAVLELVRHHGVRVEQNDPSAEIWILRPLEESPATLALAASP
ncbi:MAG TPA: segregation/condensation protein A [Pirellulales bacterium]|jgi:segregation and condensation protein A|nr:segregation/condensation protein A [Pirellulales bacterium]